MSKLTSPGYVSRLLSSHGIRLKKKWGQNFLVDENILAKIVSSGNIESTDTVLEVGPGIGALTGELARRAARVIALEIDERLIAVLSETLAEYPNVKVIHADAMTTDYTKLLQAGPNKLVANLPYNIATPLLYKWLKEHREGFSVIVCMVQKEVAERILARPGGKDYGTLSVVCQYAAETEMLFTVPATVFFPRPDVASAVVRLEIRRDSVEVGSESIFFRVIEAVFATRRKTILNTLHAGLNLPKDRLSGLCESAGIDPERRGETLSVAEFAKLARMFYNIGVDSCK